MPLPEIKIKRQLDQNYKAFFSHLEDGETANLSKSFTGVVDRAISQARIKLATGIAMTKSSHGGSLHAGSSPSQHGDRSVHPQAGPDKSSPSKPSMPTIGPVVGQPEYEI